jgi:hypothetical protein
MALKRERGRGRWLGRERRRKRMMALKWERGKRRKTGKGVPQEEDIG